MNKKLTIIGAVSGLACFISSIGLAGGILENPTVEDMALVLQEYDRLHIEAPRAPDLAVMNVRVLNSDNQLMLNVRSVGEPVDFMVNSGLPDGEYHFETESYFSDSDPNDRSGSRSRENTFVLRNFGSFRVSNGQIIADEPEISDDDRNFNDQSSLMERVIDQAVNLAGLALDVLIPSAQAQNLTASSDDAWVNYDDTVDLCCEWRTQGGYVGAVGPAHFRLKDLVGNNFHDAITVFGVDGSTDNEDSIVIDSDGDIHWGGNGLNFDRGTNFLSIGTTAAIDNIAINGDFVGMTLRNTFWGTDSGIESEGLDIYIFGNDSRQEIARFSTAAPEDSIHVQGNGDVGFGTSSPLAALEVRRTDGTAKILVDENSVTSATRTLFKLQNAGLTKFIIDNTDGAEWAFSNKGTSFRISRQGSGEIEMEVFNNGNMTIFGALTENSDVNAKTNIVSVDQRSILQRITEMPISQWQYKDALGENHIGPMAQDFYAAFGLGGTETGLATLDTSGVALAAIQALANENNALRQQVQDQNDRLAALEQQQVEMQAVVARILGSQQAQSVLTSTVLN